MQIQSQIVAPEGASARDARKALPGFFVSGILLAYLGAILPSWGHHLLSDYPVIGLYFVALLAGLVVSSRLAQQIVKRKGIGYALSIACGTAAIAFLYLAFFSPPFSSWWRLPGLTLLGASAGVLHSAIFQAISPMYRQNPAATVNFAGMLFGLGCLSVALLISRVFNVYTAPAIQVWLAMIPAFFGIAYTRTKFAAAEVPHHDAETTFIAGIRNAGAILFSLVLFFQFGNEWAIAGWLPLFLIQRLGISPATSILILAIYWLALLVGRIVAQWVLPRMRHGRVLIGSVLVSVFACLILIATDNLFGAVTGVLLLGGSFAPIYPLLVEKIGDRFPYYHPGFYNGIFSFAIAGGMLAPCILGYLSWLLGVRAVIELTLAGSVIVFILLSLIWLEARLSPSEGAVR